MRPGTCSPRRAGLGQAVTNGYAASPTGQTLLDTALVPGLAVIIAPGRSACSSLMASTKCLAMPLARALFEMHGPALPAAQ